MVKGLRHGLDGPLLDSQRHQEIFSFPKCPGLGSIGPSLQWVPGLLSPGLTTHLHLVSRLRMSDAITLLPLDVLRCFRHSIQRNAAMLPPSGLDPFAIIFKSSLIIRFTTNRDTVCVLTASSSTPQKEYTYALTHKRACVRGVL